jgi:hypothetical protein
MHRIAPIFWTAFTDPAFAQIDSGGGKSAVGTITHHASIGSFFATGNDLLDVGENKRGLLTHKLH